MTVELAPPLLSDLVAALDDRFDDGLEVVRVRTRVGMRLRRRIEKLPARRAALIVGASTAPPIWQRRGAERAPWTGLVQDDGRPKGFRLWIPVAPPDPSATPSSFRVVALLGTYNEADIIGWLLERYFEEGLEVYVLENHSTDGTADVLHSYARHPQLLGVERWPAEGPTDEFRWAEMLRRKEELVRELEADWYLQTDADEARQSPWPGISLRDAFWTVDRSGYNTVDFTYVNHLPVAGLTPPRDASPEDLPFVELARRPGYFVRINAFRRPSDSIVRLAKTGGHRAVVANPRLFPLNFRCDHYIVRSQEHGMRKILRDRTPRWWRDRDEKGWHHHYDHISDSHNFERPAGSLPREDDPAWQHANVGRLLVRAGMVAEQDFRLV